MIAEFCYDPLCTCGKVHKLREGGMYGNGDTAEIIYIHGVRFTGRRDLTTGRIYVESTPESKAGLTALKQIGQKSASVSSAGITEEK